MHDCVVIGAGFSGMACARQLHDQGLDVVVIEARDRLGGRTCTDQLAGATVDVGGQWIGATHTELATLADSARVTLRDQFVSGDKLLHLGSRQQETMKRYRGLIPNVHPLALLDVHQLMRIIDRYAASLDLSAPWDAEQADHWDSQTLATWVRTRLLTRASREIFDIATRSVMTAEPGALSLLGFLFYCASNESFDYLTTARGGAQHQVVEGGMVQLCEHLGAPLVAAGRVHLDAPVERVVTDAGGHVRVSSRAGAQWQARRVVCTVPPALQNRIDFQPLLPADRFRLAARMPMGSVIKCLIAYETPFWRELGLSGEAVSHAMPFNTVFDASPLDGRFGALVGFIDGAPAQHWTLQSPQARRQAVIDSLTHYFGPQAAQPIDYVDKDWLSDEWARGCYVGVMPPGLLTELGPALRRPCGLIHWAGTETAERYCGYIEGAIRSGQRAAAEVQAALKA